VPDAPVQRRPGLVDDVRSDDIRGTDWPVAPRVAEDVYSVADAVVVGSLLITLLKHADRVSSACLSMLVNAMAPIRAEAGADVWRQTTFYPFALTSRWARGTVLDVRVQCETHETKDHGRVPVIDVVATHDQDAQAAAVFLVNRSPVDAQTVEVDLRAFGPIELVGTRKPLRRRPVRDELRRGSATGSPARQRHRAPVRRRTARRAARGVLDRRHPTQLAAEVDLPIEIVWKQILSGFTRPPPLASGGAGPQGAGAVESRTVSAVASWTWREAG